MPAIIRRGAHGQPRSRLAIRLFAFMVMTSMAWAVAAADVLAVVPDVREPYRSVLYQMLDGIRKTASVRLVQIPAPDAGSAPLLTVTDERVVIALGSTAVEAAGSLSARLPIVTGAIITPTGQPPLPGISLETDPGALFKQLLSLRPGIRTVH